MIAMLFRATRMGAFVFAGLLAACGGGDGGPVNLAANKQKADVRSFTGHGVYWVPSEPGTGFFFEAQGDVAIVTFYMYESNGRPVWYSAFGSFSDGGGSKFEFSGELQRFSGGQRDSSTLVKAPTSTSMGAVSITFNGDNASVRLPQRNFNAEKFYKAGQPGAAARQPETGIYWNPSESGRGYTIEVSGGVAAVGYFHYADDGQPTWHLSVFALSPTTTYVSGDWMTYTGGQALTGAYKAPAATSGGIAFMGFKDACAGSLGSPIKSQGWVKRFGFGPGSGCRASTPAQTAWSPAAYVEGAKQYELSTTYPAAADEMGQVQSAGARGYRYLDTVHYSAEFGVSLAVRTSGETFVADVQTFLHESSATAIDQLRTMGAKGYRWYDKSDSRWTWATFLKSSEGGTYAYNVVEGPSTLAEYLAQANAQGALGYRHVGGLLAGPTTNTVRGYGVYERHLQSSSTFVYENLSAPDTEAEYLTRLNAQGARGFRFLGRRHEVGLSTIKQDDNMLFERDKSQAVRITYWALPLPGDVFGLLAQVNEEGAKGAMLHGSVSLAGGPYRVLYYRVEGCNGPACEPVKRPRSFF
jgi:hypothetical protein